MSNNVLPTVFFSQEVLERLGRDDSELKEHLHIFFKQIVIGPFKEKETGHVQHNGALRDIKRITIRRLKLKHLRAAAA